MDASLPSPTPDLLAGHARFANALARELLADEHHAEDVAQETWLRYVRRPPRATGSTRAWFRAVASRLSIEGLRTRAHRAAREERAARPEALPSVADELAQTEVLRSVAESVLALEEPYRTTVLLAYWRGWDARRIATETDTPLATVRSRLQRAHQRLRERLDRSHGREAWALALSALPGKAGGAAFGMGALLAAGAALVAGLAFFLLRARGDGEERELARVEPLAPALPVDSTEPVAGRSDEVRSDARSEVGSAPVVLRISGTVVDRPCAELGLPARSSEGLALSVKFDESKTPAGRAPLVEATARTDSAGHFALELADPGRRPLFVRISADEDAHYRRLWQQMELGAGPIELQLARAPHGVLHGSVIDERGAPLAGIELAVGETHVTSDADGTFALTDARRPRRVELLGSRHALLGWEGAQPLDEGGFTLLRARVGPAASLRLRVADASGAGLAGVDVHASLPECEQAALGMNTEERAVSGKTDEEGVVLLAGLWAERKLRLVLASGQERFTGEAVEGERLLFVSGGGRPLVIARGAELALTARIDVERAIAGSVRLADGTAVPRARVEVADLGRGNAWSRPVLLELTTDETGRFGGRVRTVALVGPLRVTASAPELAEQGNEKAGLAGLGYAGLRSVPDVDALAMPAARVDLAPDDAEALAELELVLGPRFAIRGTLLGRDGAPLARLGMGGSRLWAVPEGSAYHGHGVQARGLQGRPGAFEIGGLEPGRYDVFVSEELESFYSFENFLHRFPGIEAGGGAVELRLPARREVRIRVRLAGGEPASSIVLHRKLFPHGALEARRAQGVERVSGARPWPEGAVLGFTGIGGRATALGQTSDGYDGFEGREHALQPLEPGWYAIGVHASGAEGGSRYSPQATEVMWFEEGEHVIEFELVAATMLRGRVVGDAAGEFLAVALVDAEGELVTVAPVEGHARTAEIVDTSASGAFVMHHVPVGEFRLRVGTRAELERGVFRVERRVELAAEEGPLIEVRL